MHSPDEKLIPISVKVQIVHGVVMKAYIYINKKRYRNKTYKANLRNKTFKKEISYGTINVEEKNKIMIEPREAHTQTKP